MQLFEDYYSDFLSENHLVQLYLEKSVNQNRENGILVQTGSSGTALPLRWHSSPTAVTMQCRCGSNAVPPQ